MPPFGQEMDAAPVDLKKPMLPQYGTDLWHEMNNWVNTKMPPAPKDNSGYYEINCIMAPCPQPTFSDKVMKERADYLVKATEYQTLRKEYENSWCALQKTSKNPWGLPEGQTPPYQPEPKNSFWIWKAEPTPQPLTNSEPTSVVPFIKTPLASRI